MKWLINAAKSRKGAPMHEKLASEIVDAYNKLGSAIKKRDDTHKWLKQTKHLPILQSSTGDNPG